MAAIPESFDPDFQTPLILGESLDFSDSEESQFVGAFSDALWAKSEPILSMAGFQKPNGAITPPLARCRMLALTRTTPNPPYVNSSLVPSPMADQASQISDCVPYIANEYGSSYEEAQSPMLNVRSRQLPEIVTYAPPRGREGTRVSVQIQSPYDLHNSAYGALYLVFGSKRCPCTPTFLGFEGSAFQYGLSAEAPAFMSTGSPSFAVPVQVIMESQGDFPTSTLQVGVYTYEHVPQPSPSGDSRKRKLSSYSDNAISSLAKRPTGSVVPKMDAQDNYSYRDNRSFSPYLQPLPAMAGFVAPFQAASSPRTGSAHPSFMSVATDGRVMAQGMAQHRGPSPVRASNPTLIRTSTLQQSSGMAQTQGFNPYAMYPSKAILKLNGDLDSMAEGWSKEERITQRRLVQFTRSQTGSTIHADFKPVTLEERTPNSICISCISWEGKDECFVTSVDTIYLLESLVAVRFTVEEKNRIRRNLEGFRPLTVSKAKAESEEFFKVIMGFPAPKPRNIEKDVKVFPWKILSHALKKIIGKYSASYSSTAGALSTPMTTYASHGTGSDSGTEPHTAASPRSVSDSGPGNNYATGIPSSVYPSQTDPLRSMMPSVSQSYSTVGAYSYPGHPHGLVAPTPRSAWDMHGMGVPAPGTQVTSSACYSYVDPSYPLHDTHQGQ
ncbi:hypothetical protein N7468_007207 [Penicillium chermesinum]|uniref:DUF7082 domain-containing protein n=1 Tax=Penicillium chermesinum TaxID=63820 RepID=A0A9W9NTR3_9EURO|nr:uncharacterized protein N7468_007207 [Penicillium chermesinum]KAJ5225982.1 hypothetical protein N7468_007207 [Penicillium chermesinum]